MGNFSSGFKNSKFLKGILLTLPFLSVNLESAEAAKSSNSTRSTQARKKFFQKGKAQVARGARSRQAITSRSARSSKVLARKATPTNAAAGQTASTKVAARRTASPRVVVRQAAPTRTVVRQAAPTRTVARQAASTRTVVRQAAPTRIAQGQVESMIKEIISRLTAAQKKDLGELKTVKADKSVVAKMDELLQFFRSQEASKVAKAAAKQALTAEIMAAFMQKVTTSSEFKAKSSSDTKKDSQTEARVNDVPKAVESTKLPALASATVGEKIAVVTADENAPMARATGSSAIKPPLAPPARTLGAPAKRLGTPAKALVEKASVENTSTKPAEVAPTVSPIKPSSVAKFVVDPAIAKPAPTIADTLLAEVPNLKAEDFAEKDQLTTLLGKPALVADEATELLALETKMFTDVRAALGYTLTEIGKIDDALEKDSGRNPMTGEIPGGSKNDKSLVYPTVVQLNSTASKWDQKIKDLFTKKISLYDDMLSQYHLLFMIGKERVKGTVAPYNTEKAAHGNELKLVLADYKGRMLKKSMDGRKEDLAAAKILSKAVSDELFALERDITIFGTNAKPATPVKKFGGASAGHIDMTKALSLRRALKPVDPADKK